MPAISQNTVTRRFLALLPIAVIVVLLVASPSADVFSGMVKHMVVGSLSFFGVQTAVHENAIQVGEVWIAWTKDCAGINQFLLLLGVWVWIYRKSLLSRSALLSLLMVLPMALCANLLRVFGLVGYRVWMHPQVEGPELHYFMGFMWIPVLTYFLLPVERRRDAGGCLELMQAVAVLALLAPLIGASEGITMGVAAIVMLLKAQAPSTWTKKRTGVMAAWLAAGVGIAVLRMESFWLPWLLTTPLCAKAEWIRQPRTLLLIAASHPLFDLLPLGNLLIWLIAIWNLVMDERESAPQTKPASKPDALAGSARLGYVGYVLVGLFLSAPFTASYFLPVPQGYPTLPPNVQVVGSPHGGVELYVPGSPREIGVFWYPPRSYDRHHKLSVCMKYAGATLKRVPDQERIWAYDGLLYTEAYLQTDAFHTSHLRYVASTLGAWRSPGVHLVFIARQSDMDAEAFAEATLEVAKQLHESSGSS